MGAPNARSRVSKNQFRERAVCFQSGKEEHVRRDCKTSRQGNERDWHQNGHGAGQVQKMRQRRVSMA